MNRETRRKYKRDMTRNLVKLANIAKSVHKDKNWLKMYISINTLNNKDKLVLPYVGNEQLVKVLGCDTVLKIGDNERSNNLLILCEINEDNSVSIKDGQSVYTINY